MKKFLKKRKKLPMLRWQKPPLTMKRKTYVLRLANGLGHFLNQRLILKSNKETYNGFKI